VGTGVENSATVRSTVARLTARGEEPNTVDPDPPEHIGPGLYRAALETRFIAIGELLGRHRKALSSFARNRLFRQGIPEVEYSDEDVVQSSFRTFLENLSRGGSPISPTMTAL
jgi:hypothetical protein